ncbi:MAG TPA: hypothetical protein VHK27_14625 [Gammaproteobacteria bacterium]|nr:hypothetical protein [Gammaproteobacteria bacterium]
MKKVYVDWGLEWKFHVKCKGIRIVAYRAIQTFDEEGNKLERPKTVAYTDDLNKKAKIEEFISQNRKHGGSWMVLAYEYSCGHIV